MPDVKIKGYSAEFTYKDVPFVWLADPSQEIGEPVEGETPNLIPFTYGLAVPKTVTPDFSGGDMSVPLVEGELVNQLTIAKPADLIPENIPEGMYIAGVGPGTFAGSNGSGDGATLLDYENSSATEIGEYAYQGMTNLKTVTFPNAAVINKGAFKNCTGLQKAFFSSVTTIPDGAYATGAFYKCSALTELSLPVVTSIGKNTFRGCSALTRFDAPLVQTLLALPENMEIVDFPCVTEIGSLQNMKSLTTVALPMLSTITAAYMFMNCTKLTHIDLGITSISVSSGAWFSGATALETLILRSGTVVTQPGNSIIPLDDTLIASGMGYIYVPSALVEDYKISVYWSDYTSQIRAIEDYPDICG